MEDDIMYSKINQKQLEILLYIKEEIQKKGYPPSVREICSAVDLKSTSTVHSHLNKLEEYGYIKKTQQSQEQLKLFFRMMKKAFIEEVQLIYHC